MVQGFLPKDTAAHHRVHIHRLLKLAFSAAGIHPSQLACIAYTRGQWVSLRTHALERDASGLTVKGPGMAPPLLSVAIVARTLSLMYGIPLVAVNHCIGRTRFALL